MARSYKKRSPEELRAQAKALQASISDQVQALTSSDEWKRYLDFMGSFHDYSLNNVMLILSQMRTATAVAGFRQWQAKGRQVRKGEKAIKIFGYATKKIADATEDSEEERRVYFPMLSVFDISQTDPIDGHETPTVTHLLTGSDDAGIYAATEQWLIGQGWTITRERIDGEINGYTTTDGSYQIVVSDRLEPAAAAKTLLHEAAHAILHSDKDRADYVAHRGMRETEAESVAYVVAGVLGMDTSAYTIGYVAGWSEGDLEVIKASAGNVLKAAHILIDALTEGDAEEAEAA